MCQALRMSALLGLLLALLSATDAALVPVSPVSSPKEIPDGIPPDMLPAMDLNVDPCDDFYKYACGSFLATAEIPPYLTSWSYEWTPMDTEIQNTMVSLLEKDEGEAGILFQSCMDTEAIESLGYSGLKDWFAAVDEVVSDHTLTQFLITAQLYDFSAFFSLSVSVDSLEPQQHMLMLDTVALTLPRAYYAGTDERFVRGRDAFLSHATTLFELTGLPAAAARAAAAQVLDVETRLAAGAVPSEVTRKRGDALVTVAELQRIAPSILWDDLFRDQGLAGAGVECPDPPPAAGAAAAAGGDAGAAACGMKLGWAAPEYFDHLQTAVLARRDYAAVRAYLRWRVLRVTTPYLPAAARAAAGDLHRALYGLSAEEPPPRRCFHAVTNLLPHHVSRLYVDGRFSESQRIRVRWMLQEIRNAYRVELERLDWMDSDTRARAAAKLSAMGFQVGYDKTWAELSSLPPLPLRRGAYLSNALSTMVRAAARERAALRQPVARGRWQRPATVVNAYYSPLRNELFIPAGIIDALAPAAAAAEGGGGEAARRFGGIGSVLGHEMSHALDDRGSLYDADGRRDQWWDEETLQRFNAKGRCLASQFTAFSDVSGLPINGNRTLGECIADAGGLHMSYEAFLRTGGPDGVPAAERRLFFLGFAQTWCKVSRPEAEHTQALRDNHPPSRYRIIGTLRDSDAFSEAYSCPAGSNMNPPDKCVVW